MIDTNDILSAIHGHIARQMKCSVDDLHREGKVFIRDDDRPGRYIKILSIRDADLIAVSPALYREAVCRLKDRSRDELYESDYVFGQTLRYVPDVRQMQLRPFPGGADVEMLCGDDIGRLRGIRGFDNALSFDKEGRTPTRIVVYAKYGSDIAGLAGASYVDDSLREVGVDVRKSFRGRGLASALMHALTVELLARDKVPFYSASVTNIASQAVAIRSGYMPLWTDTYGVRETERACKG